MNRVKVNEKKWIGKKKKQLNHEKLITVEINDLNDYVRIFEYHMNINK